MTAKTAAQPVDSGGSAHQGKEVLIMALIAMLFGTEGVIIQVAYANGFSVMTLAATRFLLGTLFYILLAWLKKRPLLVARELWGGTFGLALLNAGCALLVYTAVSLIPAPLAILFFYAYPSLTALFSRLFFRGEKLHFATFFALFLSGVGLVLLYWSSVTHINPLGIVCALAAAVIQALRMNLVDRVLCRTDMITFNLNCTTLVAVIYTILLLLGGQGFAWAGVSIQGWLVITYLALAVTVVGMYTVYRGVHILGPVTSALLLLLEPPTTALMALLIFGETLTSLQLLGGFLILTAVALPQVVQFQGNWRQK